jgi:glycolate oxidase FAD binding subunit
MWVRLGGLPDALPARAERVRALIGGGEVVTDAEETALWHAAREFEWVPARWALVKVPLTPRRIVEVEAQLNTHPSLRRYSAGGNAAWITTPDPLQALDDRLSHLGLAGLVVFGTPGHVRIGMRSGQAFEQRVKAVFDPANRFVR